MKSNNGWILPEGEYVECEYGHHQICAEEVLGMKEYELEKIAVKVSCPPARNRGAIKKYEPYFLTERKEMTKSQLATIEKYCIAFGYRPPLDYFIQKECLKMADMKTEEILIILAEGMQ